MPSDTVSYQSSGYFTPLIVDYLNQKTELKSLYHRFPTLENFGKQIIEKQGNFCKDKRKVLVAALEKQNAKFNLTDATRKNISTIIEENTFTVTTGHQLNLFTGPLYFLYKIISTLNLAKDLNEKYPPYHFVPIFWMASEDHDFEEICFFKHRGKKIRWNKESSGPVGRLSTDGLDTVLKVLKKELGSNHNASTLCTLFENAYLKHDNLADATRFLANELFGRFGLVILDGDDSELKKEFSPFIKSELKFQNSHRLVKDTIEKMKPYDIQVNPREINLFYLEDQVRERILFDHGVYKINNTNLILDEAAMMNLVDVSPEKFSPNVILRPLYQEVVLPNLCYIGGGGEIAYWHELKSMFDTAGITFPILLVRNSVVLCTDKQIKKMKALGLSWRELFQKQSVLVNQKVSEISEFPIDLTLQKEQLKNQFKQIHAIAQQTDQSFLGAVKAQEVKQINGLENLEKRLLKAQKRKHQDELNRIISLQNEFFPNGSLQERNDNFAEFFVEYGTGMIDLLVDNQKPLSNEFLCLKLT